MKDRRNIISRLILFINNRQSGKSLHRIMMMLAVTIVFLTTYLLILPAITLDDETGHKLPGISLEGGSTSLESESNTSPDKTDLTDDSQKEEKTKTESKDTDSEEENAKKKTSDQKKNQTSEVNTEEMKFMEDIN